MPGISLRSVVLLALAIILPCCCCVMANNLVPIIHEVPQNVRGVSLGVACPKGSRQLQIPNALVTLTPSQDGAVHVSTSPADLVTVSTTTLTTLKGTSSSNHDNGHDHLHLVWNPAVAEHVQEHDQVGILIELPANQLESLDNSISQRAQVQAGFTHVTTITASTSSRTDLDLTTLDAASVARLGITATTSAHVNMALPVNTAATIMTALNKERALLLDDDAASASVVRATTSAMVQVDGSLASAQVTTSAHVTLTGALDLPSNSRITSSGQLTLGSGTCDGIKITTSGHCQVQAHPPPRVQVDTHQPLTATHVSMHTCSNGSSNNNSNGSSAGGGFLLHAILWLGCAVVLVLIVYQASQRLDSNTLLEEHHPRLYWEWIKDKVETMVEKE